MTLNKDIPTILPNTTHQQTSITWHSICICNTWSRPFANIQYYNHTNIHTVTIIKQTDTDLEQISHHYLYHTYTRCFTQYITTLSFRETKLFRDSWQWFYPGSIPGHGKIMNVPVFYHEVNMVLWALFSNA